MRFVPYQSQEESVDYADYSLPPFVVKKAKHKPLSGYLISVVGTLIFGLAVLICVYGNNTARDSNHSVQYRGYVANGGEAATIPVVPSNPVLTNPIPATIPLDILDGREKNNVGFVKPTDEGKIVHQSEDPEEKILVSSEPSIDVARKFNPIKPDDVIPSRSVVGGLTPDLLKVFEQTDFPNVKSNKVSSNVHMLSDENPNVSLELPSLFKPVTKDEVIKSGLYDGHDKEFNLLQMEDILPSSLMHTNSTKRPVPVDQNIIATPTADEQRKYREFLGALKLSTLEEAQTTSTNIFEHKDFEVSSGYFDMQKGLQISEDVNEWASKDDSGRRKMTLHIR